MRGLSAKFRGRLRTIAAAIVVDVAMFATLTAALVSASAGGVEAADAPQVVVKAGGKLAVPATAPLGVIATDPVLQQVLSQDFQVAGRLASASATSELTLTVSLMHRVLEPGMSLKDVARGASDAVALLEQAGVKPPPLQEDAAPAQDGALDADDTTAAQGNSHATSDVNNYEQQGQVQQQRAPMGGPMMGGPMMGGPMMGGPMPLPMGGWPVPPATAQQRSAIPPYAQQYQGTSPSDDARHEHDASAVYDTIFVARVTAGSDGGELTVVAIAHPGFDAREVRKIMAEEIANAVLH
jgi:hypothetical protein